MWDYKTVPRDFRPSTVRSPSFVLTRPFYFYWGLPPCSPLSDPPQCSYKWVWRGSRNLQNRNIEIKWWSRPVENRDRKSIERQRKNTWRLHNHLCFRIHRLSCTLHSTYSNIILLSSGTLVSTKCSHAI